MMWNAYYSLEKSTKLLLSMSLKYLLNNAKRKKETEKKKLSRDLILPLGLLIDNWL